MINNLFKWGFNSIAVLITTVTFTQVETTNSKKFAEVLAYINQMYVDNVDSDQLTEDAIRAMLEELDPHSSYIPKEEVDEANEKITGSFFGVGIRFQILKDTLQVVQTIPGGPSEKVGLRAGDLIIRIDEENVANVGLKTGQVREKLMGEKGTKVKVEVLRKGTKKPIIFTITRDKIPVHSVDAYYMVRPGIGYVKLNAFSRTSLEEIQTGISSLRKQGMKHLILDLQDNGGGLLYGAQQIADEFLSGNKLVVYSEGSKQPRKDLNAGEKGLWEEGELILLTNESSASASEILSGAIQDWDRGLIVGRRTFGKGLVQRPIDLSDGAQLRLTIARYYTPSGRFIQKPYEDNEEYHNDLNQRFLNGEFTHADSIKFPDSLKHSTLLTGRTVYSGGGIMPDIFVPYDTTGMNDMYRTLSRGGYFNTFGLTYLNDNRKKMEKLYPNFEAYKTNFMCDKNLMDEFFAFVKKETPDFTYTDEEYAFCKELVHMRIKANLAQDMWGVSEFFQIYNESDEILLKAIEVLEKKTYETMNLSKNQ